MKPINSNIKYLRKLKGLTQEEFAKKLGIKRSLLGAYEEGRAKPNSDTQLTIGRLFGISLEELLTIDISKRPILHHTPQNRHDKSNSRIEVPERILTISVDAIGRENIELVNQKAAAGYLSGYADPEYIGVLPKFRLPFLPEGTYRAFEIMGDSMLPLQPGSIVIGEYVENFNDIKDNHTYVILSKNEGIVYKRIFNRISENNTLVLRSDNSFYQPYSIHVEDVLELWKAKLFISRVAPDTDISLEKLLGMIIELQQEVIKLKGGATNG